VTIELPRSTRARCASCTTGDGRLVMVASDRVSAFDVVMAEPITNKGRVLTAMTAFWCDEMADVVPGSLIPRTRPPSPRPGAVAGAAG